MSIKHPVSLLRWAFSYRATHNFVAIDVYALLLKSNPNLSNSPEFIIDIIVINIIFLDVDHDHHSSSLSVLSS